MGVVLTLPFRNATNRLEHFSQPFVGIHPGAVCEVFKVNAIRLQVCFPYKTPPLSHSYALSRDFAALKCAVAYRFIVTFLAVTVSWVS